MSLYAYLFDEKCHSIRTLFGIILLLNLNISASLYSLITVANYAGHNFKESIHSHSLLLALINHPWSGLLLTLKSLAPNWSCMWLPMTAKFSSFRTTVVNFAGSRASEDSRF